MESEDPQGAAALLRRLLELLPPAGPEDTILAHRIEGAATALEVQSDVASPLLPSERSSEDGSMPDRRGDGPTD